MSEDERILSAVPAHPGKNRDHRLAKNREAAKLHREKVKSRTKELEDRVAQLSHELVEARANNASLTTEVKTLHAQLSELNKMLREVAVNRATPSSATHASEEASLQGTDQPQEGEEEPTPSEVTAFSVVPKTKKKNRHHNEEEDGKKKKQKEETR